MKAINYSKKFALATVAVVGVTCFAVGAHADDLMSGAQSRAVRYEDLNLGTAAGAKILYQRIHTAALQVCGEVSSRQLDQAAAAQACVDRAIASSVRAVNREQLTRTAGAHGYDVTTSVSLAAAR